MMSVLDELNDPETLLDLAVQLDGRPIPRLRMTEREFEQWCSEDVRAEWVNGEVIVMSPANIEHVDLSVWLTRLVGEFIEHHDLGKLLVTEAQARLVKARSRRNPDLMFIARSRISIVKETYIDGPPDLIMEIVSPDSESRDWRDKYLEYQTAGVREYWVIDPQAQRVEAYVLGKNRKYQRLPEKDDRIHSRVLRKFYLRPQWLWRSPLPKVGPILKELGVRG